MTLTVVIIVMGLAAVAAGLIYVANMDARAEQALAHSIMDAPKRRVRKAWDDLCHELGRPPTTPELLDRLYPEPVEGEGQEVDGLPPSHALREMGWPIPDIIFETEEVTE